MVESARPASTYVAVAGLLVFGTITSLLAKIVYELDGPDRSGVNKLFRKPWMMTTIMFIGMSFCIPIAYAEAFWQRRKQRKENDGAHAPLLNGTTEEEKSSRSRFQFLLLAIPTVFDLIATVLMNIGLLSVTASVYQMMRGAEMLFAAVFAVLFLHRRLNKFHLLGILCCVVGIALVGMSSLLSGEGSAQVDVSPSKMLLGMGLIVASQAVQAAQITFEDYFMADLAIEPLQIVGWEGIFGTSFMVAILLPIVSVTPGLDGSGFHEDTLETLHMLFNSGPLLTVILIDMAALLMYNFSGMCVTGGLGAVFRTVLETMRTLFVWLVDLLLFYTPLGLGKLGESWSNWSFLQAAGFLVLVTGTLVYGKGDKLEAKREGLLEAGEERIFAPVATAVPGDTQPSAVPGQRRSSVGTAPIAMRATPGSLKSTMNMMSFSSSYRGGRSVPGQSRDTGLDG
ncbi:g4769 [Coccomyxa viridis]|uniref:G4769 protein n=1 Tax=Coccomyxa viridis TaxID=1274662 RepID=A0ABP1FR37_9CHLO